MLCRVFKLIGGILEQTLRPSAINNRSRFPANNLALGVLSPSWVLHELLSTCSSDDTNSTAPIHSPKLSHHTEEPDSRRYVIVFKGSLCSGNTGTHIKSALKLGALDHSESHLYDYDKK